LQTVDKLIGKGARQDSRKRLLEFVVETRNRLVFRGVRHEQRPYSQGLRRDLAGEKVEFVVCRFHGGSSIGSGLCESFHSIGVGTASFFSRCGMSPWTLIEGEALPALMAMADESVDAVITDPPYSSGGFSRDDKAAAPDAKHA